MQRQRQLTGESAWVCGGWCAQVFSWLASMGVRLSACQWFTAAPPHHTAPHHTTTYRQRSSQHHTPRRVPPCIHSAPHYQCTCSTMCSRCRLRTQPSQALASALPLRRVGLGSLCHWRTATVSGRHASYGQPGGLPGGLRCCGVWSHGRAPTSLDSFCFRHRGIG